MCSAKTQDPQQNRLAGLGLPSALAMQLRNKPYIGIDEAGRGCLAGPVAAAAVFCPSGFTFTGSLAEVADSKSLSAAKRQKLALSIKEAGLFWGLGLAGPEEIDRVNILCATFRAMSRAVYALWASLAGACGVQALQADLFIDGNQTIPLPQWQAARQTLPEAGANGLTLPQAPPRQRAIVRGDALLPGISAASILAKTVRDSLMQDLHAAFPQYGFAGHKGYGTQEHLAALQAYGPCSAHRRTFRGTLRPEEDKRSEQLSLLPRGFGG